MNLNVSFDQSVSSLPAGFVNAVDYVVNLYDQLFTNNVTVNIDVGYGEIDGMAIPAGDLSESDSNLFAFSYSQLRNRLLTMNTPGAATLPVSDPTGGEVLGMPSAEAKALGLMPATDPAIDGYVGVSSSIPFSYAPNVTPAQGEYYFVGAIEHELSEDMGRISLLARPPGNEYSPMDLFRYSAPGVRQMTTGAASYFSINSGITDLNNWNNFVTGNLGDLGDWAPTAGNDAYDDVGSPGVISTLSSADLTLMNALGWTEIGSVGAVWLSKSGNNLLVQVLGTAQSITLSNWYTSEQSLALANLSSVGTTALSAMATAMIAYQTAHPTFDPQTASTQPSDPGVFLATLQANGSIGPAAQIAINNLSLAGGASLVGVGYGLLDRGGPDLFVRTSTGQVTVTEYNQSGQVLTSVTLTSGGVPLVIDSSTTVIGTGVDLLGGGGRDVLVRIDSDQVDVWEISASGAVVSSTDLTTNQGAAIDLGGAVAVIGSGVNLIGTGGRDLVFDEASGQTGVWEVDGGTLVAGWNLTFANYAPADLGATTVIGSGLNLTGDGGHDLVFANDGGQVGIWEINAASMVVAGYSLTFGGGSVAALTAGTAVIGSGTDLIGDGGSDLIFNSPNGQTGVWEINGSGVVIAGWNLTFGGGTAAGLSATTTMIGSATNLIGAGGHDLVYELGSGQVGVWEVNGAGTVLAYWDLTFAGNVAAGLGSATTVVGSGTNLIGTGGRDLFFRSSSSGQVGVWEIAAGGRVVAGWNLRFLGGAAATFDGATQVIGTGTNLIGTGGNDVLFRLGNGQLGVWEVNGTGTVVAGWDVVSGGQPFTIGVGTTVVATDNPAVTLEYQNGSTQTFDLSNGAVVGASAVSAAAASDFSSAMAASPAPAAASDSSAPAAAPPSAAAPSGGTAATYQLAIGQGAETITNPTNASGQPSGALDIGAGVTTNQLWLQQVGNNLQIDIMGTTNEATIAGWYATPSAQLAEIVTADGSMLDSQLNSLVSAMATFAAANPGFNPTSPTNPQAPADATLQAAIAAAWHH
jgi:hypothetical protein